MREHKHIVTIQLKQKHFREIKKVSGEIAGFKTIYPLRKHASPDDNIEAQIIFSHLSRKSRRYLDGFLKRRNAKIVSDYSENNGLLNPESKKVIGHSAVAFAMTFVASVISINSFATVADLNLEFIHSVYYAVGPSSGAFFSNLVIHYRL